MSCRNVQELISPFIDGNASADERGKVLAHIGMCPTCGAYLKSMQEMRYVLRTVRTPAIPAALSAKLKVTASHARERQLANVTLSSRFRHWHAHARLFFDNLMRPVALPFAGGLSSALVIFGLLVPSLSFPHNFADQVLFTSPEGEVAVESPSGLYGTRAVNGYPRILPVDAAVPDDANVVELTVDRNGKVSDYSVARGKLTPDLLTIIMFSKFTPATYLGQPTSGKVKAVETRPARRTIRS